ncbi:MAG: enhancer of mRNA decapping [Sclerophora amabilis]|nr:MAG: enhancer of mRNA decapping [Sclerophora amabilis]
MATQFIGLTVNVVLKSPPGAQLHGLVEDVNAGQLTLRDVYFPQSGYRTPEYRVVGSQIADLEVAPKASGHPKGSNDTTVEARAPTSIAAQQAHQPNVLQPHQPRPLGPRKDAAKAQTHQPTQSSTTSIRPAQHFDDPAILSVGPKPVHISRQPTTQAPSQRKISSIPQEMLTEITQKSTPESPNYAHGRATHQSSSSLTKAAHPILPKANTAATLTTPFNELNLNGETEGLDIAEDGTRPHSPRRKPATVQTPDKREGYTGKRSRRGGKGKIQKDAAIQTSLSSSVPVDELGSLSSALKRNRNDGGKKAWREDALLEDPREQPPHLTSGAANHHGAPTNRKVRRHRAMNMDDYDGWATEEATDIQGMGEFDFEGNLSKFDKKSVFSQIKADDTTADENRLVSFNRSHSKGRGGGGKNLHHTENVLDHRDNLVKWNSEAGDSAEDDESDLGFGSGRSSRRAISRQSTKQAPSRKGSAIIGSNPNVSSSAHLMSSLNRGKNSSSITASPKLSRYSPSGSPHPGVRSSSSSAKPSLRLLPSDRMCPVVSPLQMLDVERIAEVELGLTEDMMTENAARCIAEVALLAVSPGGSRLEKGNHNALPVVVVLVGNNKSGVRAVAGGRHLRNHGVRVIICVLGLEREEELLENLRRQLHIFRSIGGRLARWDELAATLKSLDAPPELVIDGLLGMHVAFEDLRNDDQLTAYELIAWANASKANVLAIDVPTGLDASTGKKSFRPFKTLWTNRSNPGEVSLLEDRALQVRARFIVAMGAPKSGLLNALISGQGQTWQLFVADIGISNTAWRKYGTRRRHGVEFATDWVVGLRYQAGVE